MKEEAANSTQTPAEPVKAPSPAQQANQLIYIRCSLTFEGSYELIAFGEAVFEAGHHEIMKAEAYLRRAYARHLERRGGGR